MHTVVLLVAVLIYNVMCTKLCVHIKIKNLYVYICVCVCVC